MSILTILLGEVCSSTNWLISSSKGTELLSLYTILPSFIEISQELFEIIEVQTLTHTDRQTDRHIHADENNTCPKSKILGQVIKRQSIYCTARPNLQTPKSVLTKKVNKRTTPRKYKQTYRRHFSCLFELHTIKQEIGSMTIYG